ncbi:MAG: AAA family ATPase [Acidobacteria bacterium]|nr:AAA family ATPase [Acidobacteriota bacterium]
MKRVVVIGTSGTGKTTFAGKLARLLNVPHIELDQLHWNPNWRETPRDQFIEKVKVATDAPAWVVDGNYTTKVSRIVWQRADTIVWLEYPFRVILFRLLIRTFKRLVLGEECCNGNRESWRMVFSHDSIILWAFQSHWRHRREYAAKLRDPAHAHLRQVRLRTPAEAERWLKQIRA